MFRTLFLSLLWPAEAIFDRLNLVKLICVGGSLSLSLLYAHAEILHVGNGHPYPTLNEALAVVDPGDVVRVHEGVYSGGLYFENIQGTPDNWIFIEAAAGETVIFEGGNNAWQFTDAAYLHISGFIFEHQTGNGLNFDDGGSYDTPAHDIIFEVCIFRDMNATGNNDLLKLSGLNDFEIRNCLFLNGADGGSGIDMVGCHDGIITGCLFESMGSNSIQAKGGTRNIRIEANFFNNGGERSLNLGGSTGLPFFRPLDAEYEAADLKVYSNVFIGSTAPIAYVGCINTEVINNTIYLPENWVLRILQETVDTSRFFPCGNNSFINNLIYLNDNVNVECNIGPNTAPETFTFSNNLWFHSQQPGWPGPDLPVQDIDNVVGEDPLLVDPSSDDFTLTSGSPAIGQGLDVDQPDLDFNGDAYNMPRSIGAFEGNMISAVRNLTPGAMFEVQPNPASHSLSIVLPQGAPEVLSVSLKSIDGRESLVSSQILQGTKAFTLPLNALASGIYVITLKGNNFQQSRLVIVR